MTTSTSAVFTGQFRHGLDDKNRLTIPSAWRSAHAPDDVFLAVPNPDGYVSVLPPPEVEKLREKIASVPLSDASAQAGIAAFFASTQSFSFDKQGRVPLGDALLRHAGIAKDVVLGGAMTKFNIFSPSRWAAMEQATSASAQADFMRRFGI